MVRDPKRVVSAARRRQRTGTRAARSFPKAADRVAMALLGLLCAGAAAAGGLSISGAWIRLLPGDLPAAGYFVLTNDGSQAVTLVGASTPDFASAMLHETVEKNGLDSMVHVARVRVGAHDSVQFRPGGYHVMLMHRRRALKVGETVRIMLRMADGSHISADFIVRGPAATGPE